MSSQGFWALGLFFPQEEQGLSVKEFTGGDYTISRCAGCPKMFPETTCPREVCRFQEELEKTSSWDLKEGGN